MSRAQAEALETLFDEVAALFHRLRTEAEELHGEGEMTAGLRGVLRSLDRVGPQTVPQLARARPVSRQHIQLLVNRLSANGLVKTLPNPAHRRSSLVVLTAAGKRRLRTMANRETELLTALNLPVSAASISSAARLLRIVREALGDDAANNTGEP